ncbi:hypothetical protein CR51_05405 [Caballeronia megalochromosomata]|nr:hypothetical protein CR51_05405 [Caballeronia megalochromosomata]
MPGFHDAELISVEHNPDAKSLALRFKRVSGPLETLMLAGVVGQRMIDFSDRNVASRLLASPTHHISVDELREWVRWINSRNDAKAPEPDRLTIERLYRDLVDGRKGLCRSSGSLMSISAQIFTA